MEENLQEFMVTTTIRNDEDTAADLIKAGQELQIYKRQAGNPGLPMRRLQSAEARRAMVKYHMERRRTGRKP